MTTLSEKLNFSTRRLNDESIEIDKRRDINLYETLCLYCADNDINLCEVSEEEFDAACEVLKMHGSEDMSSDTFFFWIDK